LPCGRFYNPPFGAAETSAGHMPSGFALGREFLFETSSVQMPLRTLQWPKVISKKEVKLTINYENSISIFKIVFTFEMHLLLFYNFDSGDFFSFTYFTLLLLFLIHF
jgi:hypothetical protein